VYALDTDAGVLLAYRYDAGGRRLELLAARSINADRRLRDFNTMPPPDQIQRLIEIEQQRREQAAEEAEERVP
jgi:hypothetical protein